MVKGEGKRQVSTALKIAGTYRLRVDSPFREPPGSPGWGLLEGACTLSTVKTTYVAQRTLFGGSQHGPLCRIKSQSELRRGAIL